MMYPTPLPSEHHDSAIRLGLTSADLNINGDWLGLIANGNRDAQGAQGMILANGVAWFPPIENGWVDNRLDNDAIKSVRATALRDMELTLAELRYCDTRQHKASRDNRYSPEGRHGEMKAAFRDWFNGKHLRGLLNTIPAHFKKLAKEIERNLKPYPLAADNSAGAILDSEYRGIVRSMDEVKRVHYLRSLALNEPESPITEAVLRATPAASGISAEFFGEVSATWGAGNRPTELASIWTCAALVQSLAGMVAYGTQRLATPIGEQEGGMMQTVFMILRDDANRVALDARLNYIAEHAARVSDVAEDDAEDDAQLGA